MPTEAQDLSYQPKAKVIEHPQRDASTGFDYRVHIKDATTGKLIRIQDYAKHMRGGEVLLERPIGSGNCFREGGQEAGRWDTEKWSKISDTHIEVAEAPANHMEALTQRNEALEREIAALKAEAEKALLAPKTAGGKPTVQKA